VVSGQTVESYKKKELQRAKNDEAARMIWVLAKSKSPAETLLKANITESMFPLLNRDKELQLSNGFK
jgi:hypothetical protein